MKLKNMLFLLPLAASQVLFAQSPSTNDIKGYIKDSESGEELVYANIAVEGTNFGAITNNRGHFVIVDAPAKPLVLLVSYIGYNSQRIEFDNSKSGGKILQIELKATVIESEEVVVLSEQYKMWKPADEVSQIKISPQAVSSLPRVGEADIFRSLQLLPGISAISDGSSGLYVRGGTPDQNLVLLDGMTVYHVDHFFGFFSAFNSDAVKDVQVYKGGYPANYGSRLSSVVDLTGKTGNVNDFKMSLSANLLSASGVAEIPLNGKGSILISARRSFADFIESSLYNSIYSTLTGGEPQTNQGPRPGGRIGQQQETILPSFYFFDLNTKISYQISDADFLSLSIYSGSDYLDQSQDDQQFTLRGGNNTASRSTSDLTEWGNLGASLRWARQWSSRFYSNALIAYSNYYSDYILSRNFTLNVQNEDANFSAPSFGSIQKNNVVDATFRLDNEWDVTQNHKLQFGTWISSMQTKYKFDVNDTLSILDIDNQALRASAYLLDKWSPTEFMDFNLGIRGIYYDQLNKYYVEPRVSGTLSILDNLKLKTAWGQYHQFINQITDENVLEGNKDFWVLTDEAMQPGFSEHYILGLEFDLADYLFSVEGYYKTLDNLFEFNQRIRRNPRDFGSNQNNYINQFLTGSGYSKGIEFLAQKKFGKLTGWLSYTLGKVEYTFPEIDGGQTFPADQDRTHEVKIVASYNLAKWNFSANWIFATGKPYTSPESQYFLTLLNGDTQSYIHVSDKNANRLPDYHRLDVSAAYKFNNRSLNGEFGISIFNLYNHSNIWYKKYDLEVSPISVTDVTMLGITPTIFVKFNF